MIIMKKSVILITYILVLFVWSCTDVLEKYPLDKPSSATFYTNAREIQNGINACYKFLQETGTTSYAFPIVLDCMADTGFPRQDGDQKTLAKNEQDDKNGWVKEVWRRCYLGIGEVNNILKVIEDKSTLLTADQIKQFKGEALFLRAYYYTRLVTYYGDVPLSLSPVVTIAEGRTVTRTPKAQVIQQIMTDYNDAASMLKDAYTASADIGRPTVGTANAYKARAALYFGMFDVAASAADAVIKSGKYALYPKYGDLFLPAGLLDATNKEIILKREFSAAINDYHALPQYLLTRNVGGWACMVPSQSLIDSYDCADGKNIAESPLFDKSAPFENRDPRLKLSFIMPGMRFGDFQFESHYDSTTCWNYVTRLRVTNNDSYQINQYTSYTGYYPRKYNSMDYKAKLSQGDYPLILCRYAEVLLTYAEAKIELGDIDQSVVDVINQIRQGRDDVKMPPYTLTDFADKNTAQLKVRHERKIELAFEGFRFTDVRRWGWANTYCNLPILGRPFKGRYSDWPAVTFDENGEPQYPGYQSYAPHPSSDYRVVENRLFTTGKHELWPIPESERILNPGLGQNPGY